ncbi:MAG: pitrilysin family protein [Clostridia bacterium]|nr:pitrilysin family protein [Clostridia bacterium]MDD4386316.1 pitrilysin family protein [Clostridia bacterium]
MKNKIEVIKNETLSETIYKTVLSNGLEVYICIKAGFTKKIGMFGTKYGSINNDFIDISSGKRVDMPDGISHFLEHKLFEKEGDNSLDLFSKEGISANAYTSFDHTVYFFETINKFRKGLEMLIELVKTPYFTVENVKKEQGIIGQEISMYENDPNFNVYFNTLRAMYINHPIRIDIAGTIDSISKIDKDILYTCYNTFYNSNNMFIVVIGDVDVSDTISIIEDKFKLYKKNIKSDKVIKFRVNEPNNILQKKIEKDMGLYMPQISIGYKLLPIEKDEIIKREVISDIISEMYFSKSSKFYEIEYNKGAVSDDIDFIYEGTNDFSHIIISTTSPKPDMIQNDIFNYIDEIKNKEIDANLFKNTKRRKIGENIVESENLNNSYRRIIDSILHESQLYYDIEILNNIAIKDIKDFLNILDYTKAVISIVK